MIGSYARSFGLIAFVLLGVENCQRCFLRNRAETSERLLIDALFDQTKQRDLPLLATEGLHHRFALADSEVVPICADESQTLARRNIGIDAHDRHAAFDRLVDWGNERRRIP